MLSFIRTYRLQKAFFKYDLEKKGSYFMYLVDEKEKEYRHGDYGPKYLVKGSRSNFVLCQLRPGEVTTPHVHRIMKNIISIL